MTRRKYSITIIGRVPSKLVERVSFMYATSILRSNSAGTTENPSSIGKETSSCICQDNLGTTQSCTGTHEKIED